MLSITRQIRTSGRGSGSVELTLPKELRHLVGLACRITLREGVRTEIVLEPDMARALAAFVRVWSRMANLLIPGEEPPFNEHNFEFNLHAIASRPMRPALGWSDGLALARESEALDGAAIARILSAFGVAMADRLGIAVRHGPNFGAVCGVLATGNCVFAEWHQPTDMAAAILSARRLWLPGAPLRAGSTTSIAFWDSCAPSFAAAVDLFVGWSEDNGEYEALGAAWRRGRSIEMNRGS